MCEAVDIILKLAKEYGERACPGCGVGMQPSIEIRQHNARIEMLEFAIYILDHSKGFSKKELLAKFKKARKGLEKRVMGMDEWHNHK